MAHHGKTSIPKHEWNGVRRCIAHFGHVYGFTEAEKRIRQINELPTVEWKGKTLYTLRCNGVTGKGPHLVNVPESLLWELIDFSAYRCPYHA